ncbi:MAG: circadian clock protein KaiC, partial [Acidobacteriia bacterium]|nr:circadian clock protein KaiC [Terriglobia bacterium]
DSVEALFSGLTDEMILRSELRRLFHWLKERDLTAMVTAERGEGSLTRHGLEEYISDCVILLDHREAQGVFTRRMRIVKYRGSTHGTNEFPFLIDSTGFSVLPITSLELKHTVSDERVSSGIPALDLMLGGQGYYRGSTILISGKAGTGKTTIAAHFAAAACERGEQCVFFSFEESEKQMVRNMRSIGIDLGRWVDNGLLHFRATRPTTLGLEMHLVQMHTVVNRYKPSIVVIDPATALLGASIEEETKGMILRLIDFLKSREITALMTTLTDQAEVIEDSGMHVSSLVDAWLVLQEFENSGERNRGLYIIKARGTAHSNQIREFLLTDDGVELRDIYLGAEGMLMGSARVAQEAKDAAEAAQLAHEIETQRILRQRKRKAIEAQIAALQLELETEERESETGETQYEARLARLVQYREAMAQSRSIRRGALRDNSSEDSTTGGQK